MHIFDRMQTKSIKKMLCKSRNLKPYSFCTFCATRFFFITMAYRKPLEFVHEFASEKILFWESEQIFKVAYTLSIFQCGFFGKIARSQRILDKIMPKVDNMHSGWWKTEYKIQQFRQHDGANFRKQSRKFFFANLMNVRTWISKTVESIFFIFHVF